MNEKLKRFNETITAVLTEKENSIYKNETNVKNLRTLSVTLYKQGEG